MYVVLREVIAIILFASGLVALYEMAVGDEFIILGLTAFALFLVAYWLWPSKRRGQRDEDRWYLEFLFEIIIEFPIEVFKFVFRLFFRSSSKSDGGFDIDL